MAETTLKFMELCPCIRRAGNQRHHSFRNRKIYDHELLYCMKGRMKLIIDGSEYMVTPGSLCMIKPDRFHSILFDEDHSGDVYWIHFDFIYRNDMETLSQFLASSNYVMTLGELPCRNLIRDDVSLENGIYFPDVMQVKDPMFMEDSFQMIVSLYNCHLPLWQLTARSILLSILRNMIEQISESENSNPSRRRIRYSDIIKNYISANYFRKIRLEELARETGIRSNYIGKVFKEETGTRLVAYLNGYRLYQAKKLLEETDLTIEDVSEMAGFNDIYYFSKSIKKMYGYSPTELRRICLKSR